MKTNEIGGFAGGYISLAKIKTSQVIFGAWNAWDYSGAVESHDH
jgi:hypothetical protein